MEQQLIQIRPVKYASEQYRQTVKLRDKILRKPLNMVFTEEQLCKEKDDWHLALYKNGDLAACLVLTPKGQNKQKVQMRQVAVDESYQQQGLGKILVQQAEAFCVEKGYQTIFCHARKEAVLFYKKLNYKITHGPFLEIGIEHFEMEKQLP